MGRLLALLVAVLLGPQPFSPTIPLIDLAAEPARQVVVDREEGQYLGHVTTVLLEDGRTIAADGQAAEHLSIGHAQRHADGTEC